MLFRRDVAVLGEVGRFGEGKMAVAVDQAGDHGAASEADAFRIGDRVGAIAEDLADTCVPSTNTSAR